jgi:hypothetical protein
LALGPAANMSTSDEYERLGALFDTLQSQLDALQREHIDLRLQLQRTDRAGVRETLKRTEDVLTKALQQSKTTDRLNRAEAIFESAEQSGATEKFLRAIAYGLLAIAFELRKLHDKMT